MQQYHTLQPSPARGWHQGCEMKAEDPSDAERPPQIPLLIPHLSVSPPLTPVMTIPMGSWMWEKRIISHLCQNFQNFPHFPLPGKAPVREARGNPPLNQHRTRKYFVSGIPWANPARCQHSKGKVSVFVFPGAAGEAGRGGGSFTCRCARAM